MSARWIRGLGTLCCLGLASAAAGQNLPGAIFTSTRDGTRVNGNIYDSCCDVYLNGGPQNCQNGAGLPDGDYYFMVTGPAAGGPGEVLLSCDPIEPQRRVTVSGGVISAYLGTSGECLGEGHDCSGLGHDVGVSNRPCGTITVQLAPFLETPNPGGVYKVYMTKVKDYDPSGSSGPDRTFGFIHSRSKTDNFKCGGEEVGTGHCCLPCEATGTPDLGTCLGSMTEEGCAQLGGVFHPESPDCDGPTCGTCEVGCSIICAEDATIECGGSIDPSATGSAACDGSTCDLSYEDFFNDVCLGVGTITRRWTCSSVGFPGATCDQTISLNGRICVIKFYDFNGNGIHDDAEGVAGWPITVTGANGFTVTQLTGSDGTVCFSSLAAGCYTVRECTPTGGWVPTTPTSVKVAVGLRADGSSSCPRVEFGNFCHVNASGGFTLGFWSNRNGRAILDANPGWVALLNGLNCLRNANGTLHTFTTYADLRSWLLNATATNMAYMLSVQLAANVLDGAYTGLSGSTVIIVPGDLKTQPGVCIVPFLSAAQAGSCCASTPVTVSAFLLTPCSPSCGSNDGLAAIADIRAAACCSLACAGNTTLSGPNRTYQECVKDLLDIMNNNGNPGGGSGYPCGPSPLQFVSPPGTQCPVTCTP